MFKFSVWLVIVLLILPVLGAGPMVSASILDVDRHTATLPQEPDPEPIPAAPGEFFSNRQELIATLTTMIGLLQQIIILKQEKTPATQNTTNLSQSKVEADDDDSLSLLSTAPTITSVSPTYGPNGTRVTLRGEGFTPTDNIIFTGFDRVVASSANGESLSFTLVSPWRPDAAWSPGSNFPEIKLRFYVRNSWGQTEVPGEFVFDF
ncbi:MAG: IPT/TIG domain-containing protein [Patescibacteria group bacterium]|nr:IPT/TIG domain-containing protein [Patescibacteria group bacterium]